MSLLCSALITCNVTEFKNPDFDASIAAEGKIADALDRLATVAEKWYQKTFPEKHDVRDATITHIESDEEKELRETLGGSESTLEEWQELGPRERAFSESLKKRS
jgi:hypothetical protein